MKILSKEAEEDWKVMFEASKLFENGRFESEVAKTVSQEVEIKKVIFELPAPGFPK